MIDAINAERIELLSTRSPYWCVGVVVVMSVGIAVILGVAATDADVDTSVVVQILSGLSRFGVIVLMIMAVLAITSEHRFGTLKTSFLAVPRREIVLTAKATVFGGLTLVVSLVLVLICLAIGAIMIGSSAVDFGSPDNIRQIWGVPVFAMLCALIGLGVGAIVRQTAGAIVLVLLWMLAVETLLTVVPKVGPALGPFMPFNNAYRFIDDDPGSVDYHWGIYGSLIYFALIAVVVFVAGVVVTQRRDA